MFLCVALYFPISKVQKTVTILAVKGLSARYLINLALFLRPQTPRRVLKGDCEDANKKIKFLSTLSVTIICLYVYFILS